MTTADMIRDAAFALNEAVHKAALAAHDARQPEVDRLRAERDELLAAAREEAQFLDELLTAIENLAADIGGSRCTTEIIEDLGPANDALLEVIARIGGR